MDSGSHLDNFENNRHLLEQMQWKVLSAILSTNSHSEYGTEHDFSGIESPQDYAQRVPLIEYEAIRSRVERMESGEKEILTAERVMAFFKTSGSTAKPKHIPVTSSLMRQKVAAFAVFWGMVYREFPAIADGMMVSNFTDAAESSKSEAGIEICSESSFWGRRGRSLHSLSRWPLPAALRDVTDNSARLYAMSRLLLQTDLHSIMCLNPSTLLQFCRTIASHGEALIDGLNTGGWGSTDSSILKELERVTADHDSDLQEHLLRNESAATRLHDSLNTDKPGNLKALWPTLELVVCWRSQLVQPYLTQLTPFLEGVAARDYITQSSECMMAIPVENFQSGGALAYTMQFFEFIPVEEFDSESPKTLFSWELEENKLYEIVVTTGGGLYRYRMGDCMLVKGFFGQVPIIEFQYRLGKTSSMTGEKLTEHQVLEAAAAANLAVNIEPAEFLCYPCNGDTPHYALLLERVDVTSAPLTDDLLQQWGQQFERALRNANGEYEDKQDSGRLGDIVVYRADGGSLADARSQRKSAGVSDQQVKQEVLTREFDRHTEIGSASLLL